MVNKDTGIIEYINLYKNTTPIVFEALINITTYEHFLQRIHECATTPISVYGWSQLLDIDDLEFSDVYAHNLGKELDILYIETQYKKLPKNILNNITLVYIDSNVINITDFDFNTSFIFSWISINNSETIQTETVYFNKTAEIIKYWLNDHLIQTPDAIISLFNTLSATSKCLILERSNLKVFGWIKLHHTHTDVFVHTFNRLLKNTILHSYYEYKNTDNTSGIFIFKFLDGKKYTAYNELYIPITNVNATYTLTILDKADDGIHVTYSYNGVSNSNDGFKIDEYTTDIDIVQWGGLNLSKSGHQFENFNGCISATDSPEIRTKTSLESCFKNSYNFVDKYNNLYKWDTKNASSMKEMFMNAYCFNSKLNNWNVTRVLNTSFMFYNAKQFNSNINGWSNTQNILNMDCMFMNAISFNKDISYWEINENASMNSMFENALLFNQKLVKNTGLTAKLDWGIIKNNTLDWVINKNVFKFNTYEINIATRMFKNATMFKNGYINSLLLCKDTLIKTDKYKKEIKIQNLYPGLYISGGKYKINNISSEINKCPNLIMLKQHSMGPSKPDKDLIVSDNFNIICGNRMYNTGELADNPSFRNVYRLITDKHIKMYSIFLEKDGRLISGEVQCSNLKCFSANPIDYDYSRFNNLLKYERTI